MFRHLCITLLAFTAIPVSHSLADDFPKQSRAFPSRPLILVQHSPERCIAGCERKYQFCVRTMNEMATDRGILQMGLDQCERNYQKCVKDCS